jgi:Uma2 family endonuclease
MVAVSRFAAAVEQDQHVVLRGMSWQAFEALLALRGDTSGVRIYYLDGAIELLSTTKMHEWRKTTLARLLELWALETDVELNGYGSWTLKQEMRDAGAEPDECYIVGATDKDVPDLAIEVEWSRKLGLPKEEIYRRLGVRELWTLKDDGRLVVRVMQKGKWIEQPGSSVLRTLDVAWLASFLDIEPQSKALRALRDALREKKKKGPGRRTP